MEFDEDPMIPEELEEQDTAEETVIERFFSLEEAAGLLPMIREAFDKAHRELQEIRDQIVLYKRFEMQRAKTGDSLTPDEQAVLQQKWDVYEEHFSKWVRFFLEQGILLRDLDRGLIDFPYMSQSGEIFLLCWQLGEDGLFYFHDTEEGFNGRRPMALLPE
jgi:hypothetical protein